MFKHRLLRCRVPRPPCSWLGVVLVAKLDPTAVVTAAEYRGVRAGYRRIVAPQRARRRCRLGAVGSLQFETPEFALWHVHELLHAEGWSPARVERTLEDVVPWTPAPDELVATLMIDSADAADAQRVGASLAEPGAVVLRAGSDALINEVIEPGTPSDPVWYLRWRVTPSWHAALCSGSLVAHVAWDPDPISLHATTTAALRTDLVEASGRPPSTLQRLLDLRQAHVPLQSPRHPPRP